MATVVFDLVGPMAAFGGVAVGEDRPIVPSPSRSGVLGLVAAALGLERADADVHEALHQSSGFAVRVDHAGAVMRDYHTVQAGPATLYRKDPPRSRGEALERAGQRAEAVLSSRAYQTDLAAVVAIELDEAFPADDIVAALKAPSYFLSLGRRSCPPGQPLAPRRFDGAAVEALRAARWQDDFVAAGLLRRWQRATEGLAAFECDADLSAIPDDAIVVQRRDRVTQRQRWQFAERRVCRWHEASPQWAVATGEE